MIDLYLIRHAESEYNVRGDLVCGQSPEVLLSDRGQEQAIRLATALKNIHFDVAYTSPAVRSRHTAAVALGGRSTGLPTQWVESLHELSKGAWEGLPTKEVLTPAVWEAIKADPENWATPDGESQADVERRIFGFIEKDILRQGEGTFALFTHSGTIRCFLRPILCLTHSETFNIGIANASITHLKHEDGMWSLERINDTRHLDD
jgi:probable phosphoglycerate mutase